MMHVLMSPIVIARACLFFADPTNHQRWPSGHSAVITLKHQSPTMKISPIALALAALAAAPMGSAFAPSPMHSKVVVSTTHSFAWTGTSNKRDLTIQNAGVNFAAFFRHSNIEPSLHQRRSTRLPCSFGAQGHQQCHEHVGE